MTSILFTQIIPTTLTMVAWLLMLSIIGYLIGAFPTAYLIGKINHINIFAAGSGNMGANNTYHTLGARWGAVVWFIDVNKGIMVTLLARLLAPVGLVADVVTISALTVVIGHNWSIWVWLITGHLRGGKGAATAGGTWLICAPLPVFTITLGLWSVVAGLTGYIPLATLVTFAIGSIWMLLLACTGQIAPIELLYVFGVAVMIYWRHRDNLQALLDRRERQLKDVTIKNLMAVAGIVVLVMTLVNKL